jgi:O-acetyl-ADP-ribose deacetylase (regulator of RNase III)
VLLSIRSELQVNKKTIRIVKGDITERSVDVIVNAANSYLQHGGGVAAAIVRKGGRIIQEESNKIGFVKVGEAVMTSAGKLPCKAVIHAVGPRMGEGNEDVKLKNAVTNVLSLVSQNKFSTVSMPAISSGIFGFPKNRCAKILISESKRFLEENQNIPIEMVEFCLFDDDTLSYFEKELGVLKNNI